MEHIIKDLQLQIEEKDKYITDINRKNHILKKALLTSLYTSNFSDHELKKILIAIIIKYKEQKELILSLNAQLEQHEYSKEQDIIKIEYETLLAQLSEEKRELKEVVEEQQNDISKLKEINQSLGDELNACKKRLTSVENMDNEANASNTEHIKEKDALESQLEEAMQENEKYIEEIAQKQNIIDDKSAIISQLENSLKQKDQQIDNMFHKERKITQHITELQKNQSNKEIQYRKLQTYLAQKVKEGSNMQDYIQKQQEQIQKMQEHIQNCKQMLQEQQEQLDYKTQQENQIKADAEASIKIAEKKYTEIEEKYNKREISYQNSLQRIQTLEHIYADYQKLKDIIKNLQGFMPSEISKQEISLNFDDDIENIPKYQSDDTSEDLFTFSKNKDTEIKNELF